MRSPVHPEGLFLGGVLSLAALVSFRCCRVVGWIFGLCAAFTLYFFRDPERVIPEGEGLIVAPADGRVIGIDSVDHVPFLNGPAKRISIFLSLFSVHINRAPMEGNVAYRHYHPGDFLPAYQPKASLHNEQNSIGIEHQGCKILVRQIAGIVARRILCWKNPGDEVMRGERFGLIRFGSRTDLFLPVTSKIEVHVGQIVKGGATIVARRG